jgi:murein DD-endopeptidase MepM/ murein hydrolase activator NlpD
MFSMKQKGGGGCMKRKWLLSMLCVAMFCFALSPLHVAAAKTVEQETPADERMRLYIGASALSNIPWEYFAAIDQYERTMSKLHKHDQDESLISIRVAERRWSGALNPLENDDQVAAIRFFDGFGRDGDGDGRADRTNGADTLQALAEWLMRYGTSEQEVRIGLWDYYENLRSVQRIMQFAEVYRTYRTLDVHESVFPLPVTAHYTYRSTWGAARGWGGRRIHEGTDLFAPYGVPVRSTNFGVIETIGWNKFGGWRVGIRDMNNVYHYFAHLSGFEKSLEIGDTVKPGTVVGWVGSSGYGAPGTSGKFPPHLHYGTYRDHGMSDWAFDPYPKLRASERAEKSKR